jgi:hypothetical protein
LGKTRKNDKGPEKEGKAGTGGVQMRELFFLSSARSSRQRLFSEGFRHAK